LGTSPLFKTILLTGAAFAATLLFYMVTIIVAAAGLQNASVSAAGTAVVILVPLQLLAAIAATVFVYYQTRHASHSGRRIIWTAVFALCQLAAWAIAALVLLLTLNR
jgi:hypothetical protein